MILSVSHRVSLSRLKSDCVAFMLTLSNMLTLLSTRAPSASVTSVYVGSALSAAVRRRLQLVVRVFFLVKRPRLDMLASRASWLTCTSLEVFAETSKPYPALRRGLTLFFALLAIFFGGRVFCLRGLFLLPALASVGGRVFLKSGHSISLSRLRLVSLSVSCKLGGVAAGADGSWLACVVEGTKSYFLSLVMSFQMLAAPSDNYIALVLAWSAASTA